MNTDNEHPKHPIVHLLASVFGIKGAELFDETFDKLKATIITLSLIVAFAGAGFLALLTLVVSATYLIGQSAQAAAIAALAVSLITFGAIGWFFMKVLGKPYWLKAFEIAAVKNDRDELEKRAENTRGQTPASVSVKGSASTITH